MIFCARQLIEKAIEHNTKEFLLFVDLRKVYDFVPRDVMWLILSKYGVYKFDYMQAVGDNVAQVVVSNGLRQGCVLAPTLFILRFNAGVITVKVLELNCCISVVVNLLVKELGHH